MGGFYTNAICLFLFLMVKYSRENNLTVIHRIDQKAGEVWWAARDKFDLSQAFCSNINGSIKCSRFEGAYDPDFKKPCSCRCLWQVSTFWNKCGKWECVHDKVIRRQEGCGIIFSDIENLASRLTFIENVYFVKFHIHKQNNKTCDVNETASRYLACNGDWLPIKETQDRKRFVLVRQPQGDTPTLAQYELSVRADFGSPTITGRLIKLAFTCAPLTGKPCLLFKIIGNYTCQEKQPLPKSCISSTIMPTYALSTVPIATYAPNATTNYIINTWRLSTTRVSAEPGVVKTSSMELKISTLHPSNGVGKANNSLKSEKLSNTTIAILCGVSAFVFAVVLVMLVVANLHRRRTSGDVTIFEKKNGKGKRKTNLASFKRKNSSGILESNQMTKHSDPPPPYYPELNSEESNNEADKIANNAGFRLELKSKMRNSVRAFKFSSWRNRGTVNPSVRQLEESPSSHGDAKVNDDDDDSDDYVDEDWGSFSESDGCDNEAT